MTVDIDLEIANAQVHINRLTPIINYTLSEDHPTDKAELLQGIMSAGILIGIVSGLRASRGEFELTYDSLIPDTPEGL